MLRKCQLRLAPLSLAEDQGPKVGHVGGGEEAGEGDGRRGREEEEMPEAHEVGWGGRNGARHPPPLSPFLYCFLTTFF